MEKFKWNTLYLLSLLLFKRCTLLEITSGEHELLFTALLPILRLFRQFYPRGNVLKSNCLRAPYLVGVVLGVHCNQGCRNKQKFKNFGQLTREFVYLLLQKEGPKITKPWLRHPWFSKLCLFATVAFCYIIFPITDQ